MLTHERKRDALTVALKGELDHRYAEEIRPEIDRLLDDQGVRRLVLDLTGLDFMDSAGIGMIIGRYKRMRQRGGDVCVRCKNKRVNRMLEMAGLFQLVRKVN